MDIVAYLVNNNIFIEDNFVKPISDNRLDINSQIELIVDVQNKLMSNKDTIIPRINSTIGKDIENFRVQIKKVDKELNILKYSENKTDLEFYFLEEGLKIVERAKKSLNSINQEKYFELIRRSMKNYEMCLGRVDEGNLKIEDDGSIKIRTCKYISYNLIEHDLFSYIKRIKKRQYNIPIEEIIDEYINIAELQNSSKEYLMAICSYPVESMKIIYKYKGENNKENSDEWIKKLKLAIDIDGDKLI